MTQPGPLACAALSFAATAALLLWGVWDPADDYVHVPIAAPSLSGGGAETRTRSNPNQVSDPACNDPRIASRHLQPELSAWSRDRNVMC